MEIFKYNDDNILEENVVASMALTLMGMTSAAVLYNNIKNKLCKKPETKEYSTTTMHKNYDEATNQFIKDLKYSRIRYIPEVPSVILKLSVINKIYSKKLLELDNKLFSYTDKDKLAEDKEKLSKEYADLYEEVQNKIKETNKELVESKSVYSETDKKIISQVKTLITDEYLRFVDSEDFLLNTNIALSDSDDEECNKVFNMISSIARNFGKCSIVSVPGYTDVLKFISISVDKRVDNKPMIESLETLVESILDPVNKNRCREIFDENDIMLPEVKMFIEDSFELWERQINPELKTFDVDSFRCIGSSTGFQYTDTSDLDVQVFVKMKPGHEFSETKELIRILPNGHNIPGTHHPVNYFFIDVDNPTAEHKYENLYNMKTKKWEKKSEAVECDIPVLYTREITRIFTDGLDLLLGRYNRDLQYLQDAIKVSSKTHDISEKECRESIDRCVTQLRADIDSMKLADKLIHGFRLEAYDDNNFFHVSINYKDDNDPRKSMNEAIYKSLDKFEYRQRLRDNIKTGQELLDSISPTGDGDEENNNDSTKDKIITESVNHLYSGRWSEDDYKKFYNIFRRVIRTKYKGKIPEHVHDEELNEKIASVLYSELNSEINHGAHLINGSKLSDLFSGITEVSRSTYITDYLEYNLSDICKRLNEQVKRYNK